MWARDHARGLQTVVLSYAPDDGEGGWVEPFVGLIDEGVESLVTAHARTPGLARRHLRHTLIAGATRWDEPTLARQPAHDRAETLEVANATLRWIDRAAPAFERRFGGSRDALDALFNADHPLAARLLQHELYRPLRGIALRHLTRPADLLDAVNFHRDRMRDTGYWDVYGEQIRAFVMAIS